MNDLTRIDCGIFHLLIANGGKGYPYVGCVQGHDFLAWDRGHDNVANSFAGAESCAAQCKEDGFKYWGLECPTSTELHCHCGAEGMLASAIFFDDQKCKENNDDYTAHSLCSGPFTSSMNGVEYFHGAALIASVYLTDVSSM